MISRSYSTLGAVTVAALLPIIRNGHPLQLWKAANQANPQEIEKQGNAR